MKIVLMFIPVIFIVTAIANAEFVELGPGDAATDAIEGYTDDLPVDNNFPPIEYVYELKWDDGTHWNKWLKPNWYAATRFTAPFDLQIAALKILWHRTDYTMNRYFIFGFYDDDDYFPNEPLFNTHHWLGIVPPGTGDMWVTYDLRDKGLFLDGGTMFHPWTYYTTGGININVDEPQMFPYVSFLSLNLISWGNYSMEWTLMMRVIVKPIAGNGAAGTGIESSSLGEIKAAFK